MSPEKTRYKKVHQKRSTEIFCVKITQQKRKQKARKIKISESERKINIPIVFFFLARELKAARAKKEKTSC